MGVNLREQGDVAGVEVEHRLLKLYIHVRSRATQLRVAPLARVVLDLSKQGGRGVRRGRL